MPLGVGKQERKMADRSLEPIKLHDRRFGKYQLDNFDIQGNGYLQSSGAALPSGTAVNVYSSDGVFGAASYEYSPIGTQTTLVPVLKANGLDWGMTQTNAVGVEVVIGGPGDLVRAANVPASPAWKGVPRGQFVIGQDEIQTPFGSSLQFYVSNVTGTTNCAFGFRKVQAYQATLGAYTDFFVVNINAGVTNVVTNIGGAGAVTTVTTPLWANGETHTVDVEITKSGNTPGIARPIFDGKFLKTAAGAIPTYTFTNAITIVPFFFFIQAAGLTLLGWQRLEVGPRPKRAL
jgi:hypothetical protein